MTQMIRAAGRLLRRFVAASLLLCCSGFSLASAEGLTIAVSRTPLSLPLYVADRQGFFAAEGVQVTLSEVIGGNRAMQAMLDGKADLATASETVTVFQSFKRNDFSVIASFATTTSDVDLIAGKSLAIARPEQLAGKRIGMVVGAASHYYADAWLVFHGVDPKSTRPVNLPPEAMKTALANGEVDAVAAWEPYRSAILQSVSGARLLANPGIYRLSFNLHVARKQLGTRDDELSRVLRALLRAERFIESEPGKAQAILRERLGLEQEQDHAHQALARIRYRVMLDQSLVTTLESVARWARLEGHVIADRSPNYLGFIYTEPLRKARPERIGIGR